MTIPDLFTDICRDIVGHDFRLVVTPGEVTLIVEVFATDEHAGQLIGRQGRMANALRVIGTAAGVQQGKRVHVSVEIE